MRNYSNQFIEHFFVVVRIYEIFTYIHLLMLIVPRMIYNAYFVGIVQIKFKS